MEATRQYLSFPSPQQAAVVAAAYQVNKTVYLVGLAAAAVTVAELAELQHRDLQEDR